MPKKIEVKVSYQFTLLDALMVKLQTMVSNKTVLLQVGEI